ncbi:MAG: hypothetical protein ACJ765_03565 [Chloroflexota bacterium]
MSASALAPNDARTVRGLFLVGMAVFVVTIAIGILNGLDVVEFSRDQLLTHVHSGTLGWLTLTIVAASAWLAGGIDRRLALSLGVLIPVYVVAFYLAIPWLRATVGAVLLVAIVWLVVWAWQAVMADPALPRLAIALGLTTFTYGAIIGVLRQVQNAGGPSAFPSGSNIVGAHAAAMVFSYLILAAMGLLEWRVLRTTDRPRGGVLQMTLLFLGGLVISGTLLFLPPEAIQPAGGLYLLLELIAVGLFAYRLLPTAVRVNWAMPSADRNLAVASVFVVVATGIYLYVVFRLISDTALTVESPGISGVLVASDHSTFIGVITNLMFGLLLVLSRDQAGRWPWADQLIFWGVNLGLVIFLVGLIGDVTILKRIGTPIMGIALLLGLATFASRLWASDLSGAGEA